MKSAGCEGKKTSMHEAPILSCPGADPFVLREGEDYYLFTSHEAADGRRIPVYHSRDMRKWDFIRGAVGIGPEPESWNRRNFWAPEVLKWEGHYFLYYTAMPEGTPGNEGNRVGVAVADCPEGPYEDAGVVIPEAAIDGSPYRHSDGSLWLIFTVEFGNALGLKPGRVCVHRMKSPVETDGPPLPLFGEYEWQEGPCFFPVHDRLYLLFSTGNWGDETYAVRWATGDSPGGAFIDSGEVLLRSSDTVKGPGHCNWFTGPDGHPWLVYHGWDPAHTARLPRLARLVVERRGLAIG